MGRSRNSRGRVRSGRVRGRGVRGGRGGLRLGATGDEGGETVVGQRLEAAILQRQQARRQAPTGLKRSLFIVFQYYFLSKFGCIGDFP